MKFKFNNKMVFVIILILLIPFVYSYFKREMFVIEDVIKAGNIDDFIDCALFGIQYISVDADYVISKKKDLRCRYSCSNATLASIEISSRPLI